MDLVLGRGEWERQRGAFVPWRQENVLLEEAKTDPKGFNILSRPPLVARYNWGSGPIHEVLQRAGLFGGAKFVVSGSSLLRDGVVVGPIGGAGPVSWAAGVDELVITRGANAYSYNGADLVAIAFPDGASVRAVNYMNRRFVFVRKGAGRFYWSAVDDGRTIDALDYAQAESEPDELYDILKAGDVFWMMGAGTGEAWVLTGDDALPWTRVVQRNLGRGVRDTGCAEEIEGTVYFVSSDGMVCMIQDAAVRISDAALEEKIRTSAIASTFWFQYEGKPLLCIRLSAGTCVLDLAQGNTVSRFSTSGQTQWAVKCAMNVGADVLFGDDSGNAVYAFEEGAATDCGEAEFPRYFTAGAPSAGNVRVLNVVVEGNTGSTTAVSGAAATPDLEMRYSRDGGKEWSPWRGASWGAMGEYNRRVRFGSCGQFRSPGFLAEFRILECVPLRVASAKANQSLAGR